MATNLPLLVFPQAKKIDPPKGKGFPSSKPHVPEHGKQVARMAPQISSLRQEFERYKVSVSGSAVGLDPETVLVIEIVGTINDFQQAVEACGLEWLGEWDIDDTPPDEDFYEINTKGGRTDKNVTGRVFLSLVNEAGMRELLSLWAQWSNNQPLPFGKTKWRDVFKQTRKIRRWGIEETLNQTGMVELWRDLLDPVNPGQPVHCQIELFYRKSKDKRVQAEHHVLALLESAHGKTLGGFIDIPEIAFHAVKAEIPAEQIRLLLSELHTNPQETNIQLFKFQGVMYFRPTGQSLVTTETGEGVVTEISEGQVYLPPVAAILDGVPNLQHQALKGRLLFDDPDNLSALYQPGERKHGTAMTSLVVHGEMRDVPSDPLRRLVYVRPVMQPDHRTSNRSEHVPDDVFFEDRIIRAVRRMFEGEGTVPKQAPNVCVINLSIGDPDRPFIHTPSPLARLLDWLSWKYRVLFCVSVGNHLDGIDIGLPHSQFQALSDQEKVKHVLKCLQTQLPERRILSPAESINALSVGATHSDAVATYYSGQRTDLMPHESLFSPATRFGHGFRRSVKPEILFSGGRQLYKTPVLNRDTVYQIDRGNGPPGHKVAWDSNQAGGLSHTVHTRGTSNATALATRSAARIYEVLDTLRTEHGENIAQNLMAVLIKALLVHGAKHDEDACQAITDGLRTPQNSRKFKEFMARYLGYGAVQIERVLACTEQRGTVLGCGEIGDNEIHEYRLPLPPGLSNSMAWRRMVVTLAWFSPINPDHRNFREAKLELSPAEGWNAVPLKLARQDADFNQVLRGTVQHEVFEGSDQMVAFQDGDSILLQVACKKDAVANLDHAIPYGLAVTLEVAEDIPIPIYAQLRTRLKPQVAVGTARGTL